VISSNSTVFGQKNIFLEIAPVFQNENLQMNVNYNGWDGKTFKLDHFDYYLSELQITHDGGIVTLIDSVFLVEPQNHTLLVGNLPINQIEKIFHRNIERNIFCVKKWFKTFFNRFYIKNAFFCISI
jgi:hypothetical protein